MASGSQFSGTAIQRPSGGQMVYSKNLRIPRENLSALEKLIKVGVILSLNDAVPTTPRGRLDQARKRIHDAAALPENVQIKEIPDNMTLETEWHESENRTVMRMRIRPDPNARPSPEALRFNVQCQYMTDEGEKELSDSGRIPLEGAICSLGTNLDQLALPDVSPPGETKSISSEETEYLSDIEVEEASNEKAVQTEIMLGELLLSDSIGSISSAEVASVGVQTYITALNVSDIDIPGEEEDQYIPPEIASVDEESPSEQEAGVDYPASDTEEASSQALEEETDVMTIPVPGEKENEGAAAVSDTEVPIEEAQEVKKRSGKIPVLKQSPLVEGRHEDAIASFVIPSGVPQCLLRGDPPWVDPLIDTHDVMWDTNLEVLPNEVKKQFVDTLFPISSGLKMPKLDPLQQMREAMAASGTVGVKSSGSHHSVGSFVLPSSSTVMLRRDPELFNIHIDLHTWGFPAALHERYATSAAASTVTLLDDLPSTGELLYMSEESSSMHSIYNPTSSTQLEEINEDRLDRISVGFLVEDVPTPSVAQRSKPEMQELSQEEPDVSEGSGSSGERSISDVLLPLLRKQEERNEISSKGTDVEPSSYHTFEVSGSDEGGTEVEPSSPDTFEVSDSEERSNVEEQPGTALQIKSHTLSPTGHAETSGYEEEVNLSLSLPLALVLTINERPPLILIMDPGDLPISIAIGTKNVPLNNATALCAIKKLDGNMFRINNIDLSESAITDLQLEQEEPDKVKCKIKVDGDVRGEDIKDLASLGSTLLLNLPIEQAEKLQREPLKDIQHVEDGVPSPSVDSQRKSSYTDMLVPEENHIEKSSDEEQWQDGLPEPDQMSPRKADTLCVHPLNKLDVSVDEQHTLSSPAPESIKRKSGCRCKTAPPGGPSYTNQPDVQSAKNRYGVLAKTLKEFEQQISPLHKALDDIKCKIEALDFEETGQAVSPVGLEGSSIHKRSDSGYEQEIAELIATAQRECIRAKFPDLEAELLPATKTRHAQPMMYRPYAEGSCCAERFYSSPHIQCVSESPTDLWTQRRRKMCVKTWQREEAPCCSRNRGMNMPMDMGFTYLVPTALEMVSPSPWPHSSVYRTPSELGCCSASPSETIVYRSLTPKKARNVCPLWTSEY